MRVKRGTASDDSHPGVTIDLTGDEVATAIRHWLHGQGVLIFGSSTVRVDGNLCDSGQVYVDPSGNVVYNGKRYEAIDPAEATEMREQIASLIAEVGTLRSRLEYHDSLAAEIRKRRTTP